MSAKNCQDLVVNSKGRALQLTLRADRASVRTMRARTARRVSISCPIFIPHASQHALLLGGVERRQGVRLGGVAGRQGGAPWVGSGWRHLPGTFARATPPHRREFGRTRTSTPTPGLFYVDVLPTSRFCIPLQCRPPLRRSRPRNANIAGKDAPYFREYVTGKDSDGALEPGGTRRRCAEPEHARLLVI